MHSSEQQYRGWDTDQSKYMSYNNEYDVVRYTNRMWYQESNMGQ